MSRSDVKIQINSVAALERLIGGDSALELELRKSVVVEFSRRHLGEVVADAGVRKAIHDLGLVIQQSIANEIASYKLDWNNRATEIKFQPEIEAKVKKLAKDTFDKLLGEYLSACFAETSATFKAKAEEYIVRAVDAAMLDVRRETIRRVKQAMDKLAEEPES